MAVSNMADPLDDAYEDAGKTWNIDPNLIRSIHSVESGFKDSATSSDGAIGRGQFMPDTADRIGMTNSRDALQSIFGTAKLMNENLNATKGNVVDALRMYHGGPNRALWGPKNAAYVPSIERHYQNIVAGQNQAAQMPADPPPQDAYESTMARIRQKAAPPAMADQPPAPESDTPRSAAGMSDEDLFKSLTKGATPAPSAAPVAASGSAATMSDEDLFKALTTPPTAVANTQPASDAPQTGIPGAKTPATDATPAAPVPVTVDPYGSPFDGTNGADVAKASSNLGAGLVRGARDAIDKPAEMLAKIGDWTGATRAANALGANIGDAKETAAGNAAALADYQQQHSADQMGGAARTTGNLLAMTALGGGVNGAMGLAGRGLAGQFGSNLLTGQMGTGLGRVPSLMVQGAGIGAGTEALTGGDPLVGAGTGAVIGPATMLAGNALRGGMNMLAGRGSSMSPEVAALAQEAQARGIPLRADQLSTNPFLKTAGDAINRLPMTGGDAFRDQQHQAFNRAVAATFGEQADAITPAVMTNAKTRIGKMFDDVAAKTSVPVQNDSALLGELGRIENQAASVIPGDRSNAIRNQVTDILDKAVQHEGVVNGEAWQALTKRGSKLDDLAGSGDPDVRRYAGQIREALNDALERAAPPHVMEQLQQARSQWRSMRTVQDLVSKAPTGDISPGLLMGRAMNNDSQMAYTGGGELGTLARIGKQFLNSPPNSGTPERLLAMHLLGSGLHAASGGASLIGANTLNQAMQSPIVVNRMIQRGLNPVPPMGAGVVNQLQPYATSQAVNALLPQQSR